MLKKFSFFLMLLIVGLGSTTTASAQGKFDPLNPILEDLSEEEVKVWVARDLASWKEAMGDNLEEWNPIQMEFYKQIRVMGLSPEEKKKYTEMEFEDWITAFGGKQPDEWEVHDMLFFSAIQDLKAGL